MVGAGPRDYSRAVRRMAWVVLLVVLASACASGEPGSAPTPEPTATVSDKARREAHLVAGHDRPELPCLEADSSDDVPELEAGDTFFAPTCVVLRGRADLRLVNRGALAHSFGLRAAGVEVTLEPGTAELVSLEQLAGEGPTEFFCRFHAAAGMTGSITVA